MSVDVISSKYPPSEFTSLSTSNPSAERDDEVLEDVQDKVVAGVVPAMAWVEVMPLLVVHGNPHFGRITVIQAVTAPKVLLTPEVLWVVNVRIVIEAIPITEIGLTTPSTTIGSLVSRSIFGDGDVTAGQYGGDQ